MGHRHGRGHSGRVDARHNNTVLPRQGRARQRQLSGQHTDLIGAHFLARLAVLAIAVQRDRATNRQKRSAAFVAVLRPKRLVEQAPPDHDRLASEFRIHLVGDARDGQATIDADQPAFGFAREDTEPLPCAHLPDTIGRQMGQPVIGTRMRFGAVITAVVGRDETGQPAVRLRFGFRLVEMVERLVRVLDGAKWPLDLALGARRRSPAIGAGRHMSHDLNAEVFHHPFEHRRLCDRSVIEMNCFRDALKHVARALFRRCLGRHGVEQKAQRRLGIFAVDAAVLLVGDTGAVVDDGEQHQSRRALPIHIDPWRRLQLLQV